MPRTAPAPNLIAIPGMDPGVLIKAGGGAGGGSGAGSGSGQGGKKKATGKRDRKNSSGGKKEAKAGDPGQGSKGDPVDLVTGHVYTEVQDFAFPGPLPLRFKRYYSTRRSARDVGLGHGWSYEFGWTVVVGRQKTIVYDEQGSRHEHETKDVKRGGSCDDAGGFLHPVSPACLHLHEAESGTVRVFEASASSNVHRLTEIRDRNGNRIQLRRDTSGRLAEIIDSVGRRVAVATDLVGRITGMRVWFASRNAWLTLVHFEYDDKGDLVSARDPLGYARRYAYVDHLMVSHELKSGLTYHWKFEGGGPTARCVETWGEYPNGADVALATPIPPVANGARDSRPVKGIFHYRFDYFPEEFYTEVTGPDGLSRYEGNDMGVIWKEVDPGGGVVTRTFDESGNLLQEMNANGAVISYEYDDRGRVLTVTDPSGGMIAFERDPHGRVTRRVGQDGTAYEYAYDANGNVIRFTFPDGLAERYEYDQRGLMVRFTDRAGAEWLYDYDAHGNLVEERAPDGPVLKMVYDDLGRRVEATDPDGRLTVYTYDDRDDLIRTELPNGDIERRGYDPEGNLSWCEESGGRVDRLEYGGHGWLATHVDPLGRRNEFRYDTLGRIVETTNAAGEVHKIRRDALGLPVEFQEFDGTISAHNYDLVGNRVSTRVGPVDMAWEFDGLARPTRVTATNEPNTDYRYSPTGYFQSATQGALFRERDTVGRITSEHTDAGSVVRSYDARGRLTRVTTSHGSILTYAWSASGYLCSASIQGIPVTFGHDAAGREVLATLSGAVSVASVYDELGRLVSRSVEDPRSRQNLTWRSFEYDQWQNTKTVRDSQWGTTQYTHNIGSQLTEAAFYRPGDAVPQLVERFAYSLVDSPIPLDAFGSATQSYGPGGRLQRRQREDYVYDDAARVVGFGPGCGESAQPTNRFEWDDDNNLVAAVTQQHRVEFQYDALGRRIRKDIYDAGGTLLERVLFLWLDYLLLEEISSARGVTTHLVHPDSLRPIAQASGGACYLCVLDNIGTLKDLVSTDAEIVWSARHSSYGVLLDTLRVRDVDPPFRFLGHMADAETGLCYVRYRYYSPATGQYLSPDPIGLNGGLNVFAYTSDPTDVVDPNGLKPGRTRSPQGPDETDGEYASRIGEHADPKGYIPNYPSPKQKFSDEIHDKIDALGAKHGCHSCGKKPGDPGFKPAGPKHNFTPDHQPPGALKKGGKFRLYPQCGGCSDKSGGSIRAQKAKGMKRKGYRS